MKRIKLSKFLIPQFETPSKEHSEWFGYYNYDTLNHDNTKMLCNRATFDGIAPNKGMVIELGYFDLTNGEYHHIDDSDSWNWQQGSMLQWLPGEGNETKVIYNVSKDNHLISNIYDVNTNKKREINWSIYGITPDGKKSIALEMERSRWCRAYHYKSVENPDWEGQLVDGDGIFEVDLENNTRRLIIPIQDVISIDADPNFCNQKHWLEHVMVSPSGKRFCFLHRFSDIDNILQYQTRLCIADIDGTNLQVIDGWREFDWSHFGWKSDNEFVIYTVKKRVSGFGSAYATLTADKGEGSKNNTILNGITNVIKSLLVKCIRLIPTNFRRKLKGKITYYQYYKLEDGRWNLADNWDNENLNIDGHPSFTKDGRYMITDSYPDHKQYQRLVVYDTITAKDVVIGRFFASFNGNPASCDLHPKLSTDNNYIVVDTAYDFKHHMIQYKLDWVKIKKQISNE